LSALADNWALEFFARGWGHAVAGEERTAKRSHADQRNAPRTKRDTQAPISRQRDGTGLPDSLWVLRSDPPTGLRRELAF